MAKQCRNPTRMLSAAKMPGWDIETVPDLLVSLPPIVLTARVTTISAPHWATSFRSASVIRSSALAR